MTNNKKAAFKRLFYYKKIKLIINSVDLICLMAFLLAASWHT